MGKGDQGRRHQARQLDVVFQEVVHSALTGNSEVAKHQRFAENRMDTHKNAALTPKGREAMVRSVMEKGLTKAAAARQFNTTPKTVAKWVERFRAGGVEGLRDRSSRPLSLPSQTVPATCAAIETLRRQRYTGKQIAAEVGVSAATVSRILRRLGLNRIRDLEPAEPVRRYASPAIGPARATVAASAGSSSTSVSTIIPASHSPRSSPTRRPIVPFPSSRRPWLTTKASASPSPAS